MHEVLHLGGSNKSVRDQHRSTEDEAAVGEKVFLENTDRDERKRGKRTCSLAAQGFEFRNPLGARFAKLSRQAKLAVSHKVKRAILSLRGFQLGAPQIQPRKKVEIPVGPLIPLVLPY